MIPARVMRHVDTPQLLDFASRTLRKPVLQCSKISRRMAERISSTRPAYAVSHR